MNKDQIEIIENNVDLTNIIVQNADKINLPESLLESINKIALLQAIAMKESTYGSNNIPRYEPSFAPGGKYYKASHVQALYRKYGKNACCSYSSFQLMFITAWELGYRKDPTNDDVVMVPWVIEYINKRIMNKNPKSIDQIFDGYNSGSFNDNFIPEKYIKESMDYYKYFIENRPKVYNEKEPVIEEKKTLNDDINEMINAVDNIKNALIKLKEKVNE